MMVHSGEWCPSFSSAICPSTTHQALRMPILHSSYRKPCAGTSGIKGARKTSTLGRDQPKPPLGWDPSKIAWKNSFVARSSAYVCEFCPPRCPSHCCVGEETIFLEQGGGAYSVLVLPYYNPVDRGTVCVGYRFDNATFKHRWGCGKSCPDLLDF